MRKLRVLLFVIVTGLTPLWAEINLFAGLHGDLAFPAFCDGEKLYGIGGGGRIEGGACFDNFSLGLIAGIVNSSDGGPLIKNMTDFTIGVEAGYNFGNDKVFYFPEWLCIRPSLSFLADIYTSEGYRSQKKKDTGKKETSRGCAFAFETGISLDLPNLLSYKGVDFIPTIGYFENFSLEDDGMIFTGRLSIGMRFLFSPFKD